MNKGIYLKSLVLALTAAGCIAGPALSMRILYSNWIPLPTIRCCLYLKKRMS